MSNRNVVSANIMIFCKKPRDLGFFLKILQPCWFFIISNI